MNDEVDAVDDGNEDVAAKDFGVLEEARRAHLQQVADAVAEG